MYKIEFEGTDGAGKTTGLKYFVEEARKRAKRVVETREVGNPHIGSCVKMRELVLDPSNNLSGEAMELIFSAMRFESELWMKKLKEGPGAPDLIVSDRGFFSHIAYGIHNTSPEFVKGLFSDLMLKFTSLPHVVIYFDVSPEVAKARRDNRGLQEDAIELKGLEYQSKVRETFKEQLRNSSKVRIYHVDADQSLEKVKYQLDKILDDIEMEISPDLWG